MILSKVNYIILYIVTYVCHLCFLRLKKRKGNQWHPLFSPRLNYISISHHHGPQDLHPHLSYSNIQSKRRCNRDPSTSRGDLPPPKPSALPRIPTKRSTGQNNQPSRNTNNYASHHHPSTLPHTQSNLPLLPPPPPLRRIQPLRPIPSPLRLHPRHWSGGHRFLSPLVSCRGRSGTCHHCRF